MSGSEFLKLSPVVLISVGLLALLQLSLQIAALVQLFKLPKERVTLGGAKWLWALIIVFGELIGAIAWFAAGKQPAQIEQGIPAPPAGDRSEALDALYGPEGKKQ